MGAIGVILWISHYVGLYIVLSIASQPGGDNDWENHIPGNALFTEVPHDTITQSGEDVEMACSFRGTGSPSVSLEIQWWYIRNHKEWAEEPAWVTNQVVYNEEMPKDATKISVVKVAGSNISHKLRLSNVKPSDEGTYECRVIDFSDGRAQHHRVRAFLRVQPPATDAGHHLHQEDQKLHHGDHQLNNGQHVGDHHQLRERDHHQLRDKDLQLRERDHHQLHEGDHQLHERDHHQLHEGDHQLHDGGHHQLHEGAHHQLHEGDHPILPQKVDNKKKPEHSLQTEGKEMRRHPTVKRSDCTTEDCMF